MSSTKNSCQSLTPDEQNFLRQLAIDSIRYGLSQGRPIPLTISELSPALREKRATFVTLEKFNQLRGCIGVLQAIRPLAEDIAQNAYSAAFSDPRFPPVNSNELADLQIHLSLLTPPDIMHFNSEDDLLNQLKPNLDGLILEDHGYRGTFLPSVWGQLPDPAVFLNHLKQKAGLSANYWSDTIRIYRYRTEVIE